MATKYYSRVRRLELPNLISGTVTPPANLFVSGPASYSGYFPLNIFDVSRASRINLSNIKMTCNVPALEFLADAEGSVSDQVVNVRLSAEVLSRATDALPHSINTVNGSKALTGNSTSFSSELSSGDIVLLSQSSDYHQYINKVLSVQGDTAATLTTQSVKSLSSAILHKMTLTNSVLLGDICISGIGEWFPINVVVTPHLVGLDMFPADSYIAITAKMSLDQGIRISTVMTAAAGVSSAVIANLGLSLEVEYTPENQ